MLEKWICKRKGSGKKRRSPVFNYIYLNDFLSDNEIDEFLEGTGAEIFRDDKGLVYYIEIDGRKIMVDQYIIKDTWNNLYSFDPTIFWQDFYEFRS